MCALCSLAGIAFGGPNCVKALGDPGTADDASGGATLGNVAGAPQPFSLSQIIQQLRTQWGGSSEGQTVSWSGTGAIPYYIGGTPFPSSSTMEINSWVAMTALMVSRATLAFELWDDLIARDLTPASSAASAQIQFEYASNTLGDGTYSRSFTLSNGINSYGTANNRFTRDEIWLNNSWDSHNSDSDMYFGGYGFQTYMHEIGHSLGLSHPGSYNAGSGGTITYANNAEYSQDNRQLTIMSYFGGYDVSYPGWRQDGTFNNWFYSSTPMLHDVAAIQAIYGADMSTRTGDTTYGFHSNAGRDVFDFNIDLHPIVTVWDAGGNDTVDLSGYSTNQTIDLRPGAYSSVGGLFGNFAIAFNVTIENAIGGTGNDTLIGNDANNTMTGGPGNDVIDTGSGIDTAVFSGVRAAYTLTDVGNNNVQVSGPDGTDFIANIEFLRFSDQTVSWPLVPDLIVSLGLTGATVLVVTSNAGGAAVASTTNVYLSTDGTITTGDTLLTSFGVPALPGGAADPRAFALPLPGNLTPGFYFVGAIGDVTGAITESNESNNVSNAVAVLLGNNSANALNGTSASDTIIGLDGGDRINGGAAADVLVGGQNGDIFVFDAIALANATAATPVYDRITDYNRGFGVHNFVEFDQIDLSAILSAAYNHGNGQSVSALVRVVGGGDGTRLQVDTDGAANGANWVTIVQLDGVGVGENVNVILDATLLNGTNVAAAPAATPSDYDADLKSDIFWRTNSGLLAVWEMNGTQIKAADYVRLGSTITGAPGPDWHVVDTGILPSDFDGDGKGDVLWATDSGILAIWEMNGSQIKNYDYIKLGSTTIKAPGPDWHAYMAGDFDADGKSDILWTTDSGILAIWEMNGTQIKNYDYIKMGSTMIKAPGPDWHVIGIDDFDGDGKGDLLWRTDSGVLAIWEMDGTQIKAADYFSLGSNAVATPGPDWHIAGTGDFDGDGKGDLLWRTDSGILAIWEMNGTQIKSADYIRMGSTIIKPPGPDWHIHGTGDYDGDGRDDILWRTDSGALAIWKMNGFQIAGADYLKLGATTVGAPGSDWNIVAHHYDLI